MPFPITPLATDMLTGTQTWVMFDSTARTFRVTADQTGTILIGQHPDLEHARMLANTWLAEQAAAVPTTPSP